MEELWFNERANFTRWVTASGLLQEPFVVVDVGVQGDSMKASRCQAALLPSVQDRYGLALPSWRQLKSRPDKTSRVINWVCREKPR